MFGSKLDVNESTMMETCFQQQFKFLHKMVIKNQVFTNIYTKRDGIDLTFTYTTSQVYFGLFVCFK